MWLPTNAHLWEGCPIHPSRADSSLVFAIQQTGNRFLNPIPSKRHQLFPLLLIQHAGSWFARDLENIVDLDFEGGLKMLSIRIDSIESTWIIRIDWGLWPRFKNEEGSCIVISRILSSSGICRVGWKCCPFDSIRLNRHESFPSLLIRHAGSQVARCNSVQIESRRNVRIKSNRKVPQTNRISLGVSDMDDLWQKCMIAQPIRNW